MGKFGKWNELGVPHAGWVCEDIYDRGGDELGLCEMCERALVRYVHVMVNRRYAGKLHVGCYCAGRMEADGRAAARREREFIRQQQPRIVEAQRWLAACDRLLGVALRSRERAFVHDVREGMGRSMQPRRRAYKLTARQLDWFAKIYFSRFQT